MLTLLEIISLQTAKEEDKAEALCLLTSIANKGRQFKELLCESFGAKLVAECLALSSSEDTQECARNLLHQLCSVRSVSLHGLHNVCVCVCVCVCVWGGGRGEGLEVAFA